MNSSFVSSRTIFFAILVFGVLVSFSIPLLASAQTGIIPCDGPECQACHFVSLGQRLLTWFIGIMASLIALIFAWGGLKMAMSAGNGEGVTQAKAMMTNAIIGFVILLSAWLIIDTLFKLVVNKSTSVGGPNQGLNLGVWNEIKCVPQPARTQTPAGTVTTPPATTPPSTGTKLTEAQVREQLYGVDIVSSGGCYDPTNRKCTGLAGIQQDALNEIKATIWSCTGCNLQITAGTEVGHSNPCHTGGTCVDIACKDGCSMAQTQKVFESAKASGARAVWEGASCTTRDTLRAQGYSAYCSADTGYGHITGTHFSLYTQ